MTEGLRETAQSVEWDTFDTHNQTQFEEPADATHTDLESSLNGVDMFPEFGFNFDEDEWERTVGLQ
jgi:hypothetical protein